MIRLNSKPINFLKENKGQVFSMDVLLALIIITMVIGMSADALDIVTFKITDYSAGKSLDRIAIDAADILINTPGTPDWENSNDTQFVTPGLAQNTNGTKNTTKILSFAKITHLEARYHEFMGNVIPPGANSSLTIYPASSTLEPLEVGNGTPPPEVTEVAVVNRTVLVNFRDFKILTSMTSSSQQEICPHYNYTGFTGHSKPDDNSTTGWKCSCFKITQEDLNTTDFYILTDPPVLEDSGGWILDRPDKISIEKETFSGHPILVNDKINEMIGDDEEVVIWLHVQMPNDHFKSSNTYLIGVPKGTPPDEVKIEYLHPQPCSFVLKIWME
jgi:hypothetical protein